MNHLPRRVEPSPLLNAARWPRFGRTLRNGCVAATLLVVVAQAVVAQQVTILAPRSDTRVDFERLGMRVQTYSPEQLVEMNHDTAISLGQSIDESLLVLTGAMMPAEAFESLFKAEPVKAAFDDLFRRGGMFYIGQLNGGLLNDLPSVMRSYFDAHEVFLPTASNRPSTSGSNRNFKAYGNPDLLNLPLLSQPNSLAEGDWGGAEDNLFYWRDFPDTALPVLLGPDNDYPVVLLQEGVFGEGKVVISQARSLTQRARSEFWENLVAYLGGGTAPRLAPDTGKMREPGTDEGFEVWQVSAWQDGHGLRTRPSDEDPQAGTLELHAPGGGADAAVLLVRNHEPETLVLRVIPPLELNAGGGNSVPFYALAKLYQGVPRLSSYETLDFDPLADLANNGLLSVGPGETAMLWLDVAGKAPAGRYRGALELLPITIKDQTPVRVPIDLRIYDVEIPSPLPFDVYTFGPYMGALYAYGDPLEYVTLALDSHINTFNVVYPVEAVRQGPVISEDPADYLTNLAVYLREDRPMKFVYSFYLFNGFDTALKKAGFEGERMDEQWQEHFRMWFGHWMDALQAKGLTYDDFWIQIEDEPREPRMPDLVEETALLKKHFPEVQTTVTVAPWNTAEHLEALEPYVDMWIPEQRRLTMREDGRSELAFYKTQAAFWPYLCSSQMDMKSLIAYYRQRGIADYQLGADGIALWAFNSWSGNSWAQWDTVRSNGSHRFDEGILYRGENGPVPSKRLFAFRAGIEDHVLLHLLSEARPGASDDQQSKLTGLKKQAQGLLETSDPTAFEEWRREALTVLEALKY